MAEIVCPFCGEEAATTDEGIVYCPECGVVLDA